MVADWPLGGRELGSRLTSQLHEQNLLSFQILVSEVNIHSVIVESMRPHKSVAAERHGFS